MSESVSAQYQRLFEVRILHHYWLDDGAVVFDQIVDPAKKEMRLQDYDVGSILTVKPTAATEKQLRALKCLFKPTTLGFFVAVADTAILPGDTVFQFSLIIKDPQFYNYTALTLAPQNIYSYAYPADNSIMRYKENIAVLSNLTGSKRGSAANKTLFLSQNFPASGANDRVESLVVSGKALLQLISDDPGGKTQQLSALASDLPVYLHQGDVPPIVPPAELLDVPVRGIRLSEDIPDETFALLSLSALNPSDGAFSFIDSTGKAKNIAPIYQVRLKNRATFWKYLNQKTGEVTAIETTPLPLTYFGNAGTKQKPSAGLIKAEKSSNKITRLVSEVYI